MGGCELAMRLLILVYFIKLLYFVIYLEQAWICLLTRPIPVIVRPHHKKFNLSTPQCRQLHFFASSFCHAAFTYINCIHRHVNEHLFVHTYLGTYVGVMQLQIFLKGRNPIFKICWLSEIWQPTHGFHNHYSFGIQNISCKYMLL